MLCALVDVEAHRLTVTSAGHLPPLLISNGAGRSCIARSAFRSACARARVHLDDGADAPEPRLCLHSPTVWSREGAKASTPGWRGCSARRAPTMFALDELLSRLIDDLRHDGGGRRHRDRGTEMARLGANSMTGMTFDLIEARRSDHHGQRRRRARYHQYRRARSCGRAGASNASPSRLIVDVARAALRRQLGHRPVGAVGDRAVPEIELRDASPLLRRVVELDGSDRHAGADAVTNTRTFPHEPQSVPAARRFATSVLRGASQQTLEAVELMVSELATNCIRHTDSGFDLTIIRNGPTSASRPPITPAGRRPCARPSRPTRAAAA